MNTGREAQTGRCNTKNGGFCRKLESLKGAQRKWKAFEQETMASCWDNHGRGQDFTWLIGKNGHAFHSKNENGRRCAGMADESGRLRPEWNG